MRTEGKPEEVQKISWLSELLFAVACQPPLFSKIGAASHAAIRNFPSRLADTLFERSLLQRQGAG